MEAFLEKIATHLLKQYPAQLDKLAVIFPNRRAGLFLKKFLAQQSDSPLWAPAIYSIEDFMFHLAGKQEADIDLQLLEFYKVYQAIEKEKAQEFNDFLNWAPIALQDFNEADFYLSDPRQLFSYISEARALTMWNLDQKPLSAFEKGYLKFYRSLYDYYQAFTDSLNARGSFTQGMAYRYVAGHIEQLALDLNWERLVFAGFSALTTAEETIIRFFIEKGTAEIFWDADHYYLDNDIQEAGKFIRHYHDHWNLGEFPWIGDYFREIPKKIQIIGVPQNAGQAKIAGEIIDSLDPESYPSTAIVLGDENLLIPLLNSIPESVSEFNVTMGLPLKYTPPYELFEQIFYLHENALKFSSSSVKDLTVKADIERHYRFYYLDLLRLFDHPYFLQIFSGYLKESVHKDFHLSKRIKDLQKVFYNQEEIRIQLFGDIPEFFELVRPVLQPYIHQPAEIIPAILHLVNLVKVCFSPQTPGNKEPSDDETLVPSLELEYLFTFANLLHKLGKSLDQYAFTFDLKTLHKLFRQAVESTKLPFYGEPLRGVQVMGMLETRNLDFENVIILNMNEDILPSSKHHPSFIPFDIRKDFHLPTYQDRHAVFAYHFYRLLQRAGNVYLLYNTEPGKMAGGDRSRFLNQLIHELPFYNPKVDIRESIVSFQPQAGEKPFTISIPKDEKVMQCIRENAQKGFSASSLNKFRLCGLKYYLSEIEGLSEPEEVTETMDAATLGTAIHEVLYQLYLPFTGKNLTSGIIGALLAQVDEVLINVFSKSLPGTDLASGKNHLLVEVAKTLLSRFLKAELSLTSALEKAGKTYIIHNLEEFSGIEDFAAAGETVKLHGKIDRLDSIGGQFRIIDYKTGSVKPTDLRLKDWESLREDPKKDKVFQLLFYSLLFANNNEYKASGAKAGIISFRNLNEGYMALSLPEGTSDLADFEIFLAELIGELMDPALNFDQTDNTDICEYCSFAPVCNR